MEGDDDGYNDPVALEVATEASDVLTKFEPHSILIWAAALGYVLAISALRLEVAFWYISIVWRVHELQAGAALSGSEELKGR